MKKIVPTLCLVFWFAEANFGCSSGITGLGGDGGKPADLASDPRPFADGGAGGGDLGPTVKRVFVTSTRYTGNLMAAGSGTSGISGANNLCNLAAQGAALGGTFTAWISESTYSPITFLIDVGPWYLVDQRTKVFDNKNQIATTGIPQHAIDQDEKGAAASPTLVWTGTMSGGGFSKFTCGNWASDSIATFGSFGDSSAADSGWVNGASTTCDSLFRLYCFEQ